MELGIPKKLTSRFMFEKNRKTILGANNVDFEIYHRADFQCDFRINSAYIETTNPEEFQKFESGDCSPIEIYKFVFFAKEKIRRFFH